MAVKKKIVTMRDERLGKYRNVKVSRKESWRILPIREKRHHQYPELDQAVALICALESCVCRANASGGVTDQGGDQPGPQSSGVLKQNPLPHLGPSICTLDCTVPLKKGSMENYRNNI